ncbi:MAG: glycoside hydrolase family 9 protein [Cyclobacteriaceae bacterium]
MKTNIILAALVFHSLICVSQINNENKMALAERRVDQSITSATISEIRYNQVGYFTGRDKLISIVSKNSFSRVAFTVQDAAGNTVLTGTSGATDLWGDSREYVSIADVSAVDTPGLYKFEAGDSEVTFRIGSGIYQSISEVSLKYYYYNRASASISSTYGGAFERNLGHPDDQVFVHSSASSSTRPTGTIISSPKGWYDAGDYNKYIVNSGISTYTLLAAYEHYESYYQSKRIGIPEAGGNLPDILDEVKWNLDWMLTMQEPSDGGVYHKLTGLNFSGIVMPDQYTAKRYVVQKSTSAALNFAAVMAIASRIFWKYETEVPGYSTTLIDAAKAAYDWAKSNPTDYYKNPNDVATGEYGDSDVTDEFQWAAVELFITTGETSYSSDVNISSIGNGTPSWQYTDPLALISILNYSPSFPETTVDKAKDLLLNTADALKNQVQNSAMRIGMGISKWDYVWGSNGVAANQVMLLIRAYETTGDDSYLDASYIAMDYLLGRNGTGYCYVTGFGDKPTLNPHHRISEADNIDNPVPGMLCGGPNPGQQDGCVGYLSNESAGSYVDDWCSYASNEVTINWNAPLAYAINALHFYQNGESANVLGWINNNPVDVYPNPTDGLLNLDTLEQITSLTIYNASGKVFYTKNSKNIDMSGWPQGLYLLKIEIAGRTISRKIIKQ